jgi:hypothetical protein
LNIDPHQLNQAVIHFLGYGKTPYPDESPARLLHEFGAELAPQLQCEIAILLKDLNELRPDWSIHSLVTAGFWAREEIQRRHPYLEPKALDALVWLFTWWWK